MYYAPPLLRFSLCLEFMNKNIIIVTETLFSWSPNLIFFTHVNEDFILLKGGVCDFYQILNINVSQFMRFYRDLS